MVAFEIILRKVGDASHPSQRFPFDLSAGEELVFGRAATADVVIPDPNCRVSSRHAKLLCNDAGDLLALDLDSLNGTYLEGGPIDGTTGTVVSFGAQLRVGDYMLEIANPQEFETIQTADISGAANALITALEQTYETSLHLDESARRASLQVAVEQATTGLNQRESTTLLESLLGDADRVRGGVANVSWGPGSGIPGSGIPGAGIPGAGMPGSGPPMSGANASPSATPGQAPLPAQPAAAQSAPPPSANASGLKSDTLSSSDGNAAERALRQLASQLVPDKTLESDEDFETLGQLLQQVCQSTLSWLAKGLQGRGVFAEEFGAEVTLVFQRSNNPLKAMSFDDLREYLLDWRGEANAETRHYYLEAVLQDMSEHQVGIIAGVKEAVAGVFAQLSPQRIEKLAESAKGWSKGTKVWSTYQQVHKELSEEQSKLFNEMITPAIQKGYLHQHGDDDQSSSPPPNTQSLSK